MHARKLEIMENNLFNLNSIQKHLKNFKLLDEKKAKLEKYVERVNNNEFKGETKGYPAFLKFLEEILDYDEAKHILFDDNVAIGKDRVEFALKDENGKFMVIELKGQDADLEKPQNRANDKRTPVEQAFGYAQKSSKESGLVDWILVSNYKEFRLYNYEKRQGEYISFNVDDLLKDEKEFKYFMFAFSKKSHIDLKAINYVINEEYIEKTKLANNFYKLFNETRLMIYKELKEQHNMAKEDAISYAQTIVDRFIFICFASSRELLPDDIARKTILGRIKSENLRDHEIWRELNYLFIDVNEGREDRDISGYNGGLFKEDLKDIKLNDIIKDKDFFKDVYQKWNFKEFEDRLNKEIKPSILKRLNPIYINLLIISYFDFSEEKKESNGHRLDIDILGHIFENSIGDIEELKADSKGRRKKDGIFYTPDYITDYICKNTIIPYLSVSGKANTVDGLLKEYSIGREVEKLDEKLKNIKIIDPACGSGAFLNKATDILLEIHEDIFEIKKQYTTSTSMRVGKGKRRRTENVQHVDLGVYVFDAISKRREILLDNIYGVDLNSESVEITKLSLFLKVCEKGKKLPELDNNIKCGNSLIDDPDFTDKPFRWEEEFKDIIEAGGFDIVIGNPPYVQMQKMPVKIRKFCRAYYNETYASQNDLWYYFLVKGIKLLKNNGLLGFIVSRYFLEATYAKKTRNFIVDNAYINQIVDFANTEIFKGVGTHTSILVLEKNLEDINDAIKVIKIKNTSLKPKKLIEHIKYKIKLNEYEDEHIQIFFKDQSVLKDNYWVLTLPKIQNLINKLNETGDKLGNITKISNGIKSGYNKAFIINKDILENYNLEKSILRPLVKNSDIKRYSVNLTDKNLIYLTNESNIDNFPNTKSYLLNYKEDMDKKWDSRGENGKWFALYRPREFMFDPTIEKLICPYRSSEIRFSYDNQGLCGSTDIYALKINKNSSKFNLKYLLAILNSKLLSFYYKLEGKKKGDILEVGTEPLSKIPIPVENINQNLFIEKADKMLQLNNDLMNEINSFKEWLQLNFNLGKFSKKLDKYYELDLEEFLKELKNKKVKLKPKDIKGLKEEFYANKNRVTQLNNEIEKIDNEINEMVYQLYDLTDEEIQIIKDNLN